MELDHNAIKFTPQGGALNLTCRMIANNISLSIRDTGVGIPKEELPSLFLEFKRLKGSANIDGSGLGLFIVKTILDSHNGIITAESEEGAGTTFKILLPAHSRILNRERTKVPELQRSTSQRPDNLNFS